MAQEWFDTPEYKTLSPMAKTVFQAACMRYQGSNNGDIALPFSYLREWQCTGNRQRSKAIAELINNGFLIRTRHGGLRMGPDLFAISFKPIDACINPKTGKSKHEFKPGNGHLHLWRPDRECLRDKIAVWKRRDGPPCRTRENESSTALPVNAEGGAAEVRLGTES
jgi:hypothetical protein